MHLIIFFVFMLYGGFLMTTSTPAFQHRLAGTFAFICEIYRLEVLEQMQCNSCACLSKVCWRLTIMSSDALNMPRRRQLA